jgi:amino acid transporter
MTGFSIVATIFYYFIAASLAELSSAIPSSAAGVYFFLFPLT